MNNCENIKLIATDLDKTLLRTDKSISAYTSRILRECKRRGILIAFATMRSEHSSRRFTEIIKPDAIISSGGALARTGDTIIYRAVMDVETTSGLIRALLDSPDVGLITVETDAGYFTSEQIDADDPVWADFLPARYVDMSKLTNSECYKIGVEIFSADAANRIASAFPTVSVISFTGEDWYRFGDIRADKWNGVRALADHAGVGCGHVAAFGDDFSDVGMLRGCGVSVAVSDAIDELKSIASHICGACDDDGVAKWLEEHVLSS